MKEKLFCEFGEIITRESENHDEVFDSEKVFSKINNFVRHYDYSDQEINELIAEKVEKIKVENLTFDREGKKKLIDLISGMPGELSHDKYEFIHQFVKNLNSTMDVEALDGLKKLYKNEFVIYENENPDYLHERIYDTVKEESFDARVDGEQDFIIMIIEEIENIQRFLDKNFQNEIDNLYDELDELQEEERGREVKWNVNHSNEKLANMNGESEEEYIDRMFATLLN